MQGLEVLVVLEIDVCALIQILFLIQQINHGFDHIILNSFD
jgi:hypothetical protein